MATKEGGARYSRDAGQGPRRVGMLGRVGGKVRGQFGLALVPYPNAEGSPLPANNGQLTQIEGKFYDEAMLRDPAVLTRFGFSAREVAFLSRHPWYELPTLYIDDLIGKGFQWYIILELMMYASMTNVAMALPLSVLLSSIMTYGSLGENYELVAIKSAGISLSRAMYHMMIVVTLGLHALSRRAHTSRTRTWRTAHITANIGAK